MRQGFYIFIYLLLNAAVFAGTPQEKLEGYSDFVSENNGDQILNWIKNQNSELEKQQNILAIVRGRAKEVGVDLGDLYYYRSAVEKISKEKLVISKISDILNNLFVKSAASSVVFEIGELEKLILIRNSMNDSPSLDKFINELDKFPNEVKKTKKAYNLKRQSESLKEDNAKEEDNSKASQSQSKLPDEKVEAEKENDSKETQSKSFFDWLFS